VSQPALLRQESAGGKVTDRQSPVEFSIQPNVVKIPAGTQAVMLNISAKLKNSYVLDLEQEELALTKSNSAKTPYSNPPESTSSHRAAKL
jgi:hypothetical protein